MKDQDQVRHQLPSARPARGVPPLGPAAHAARAARYTRRTLRAYPLPLHDDGTGEAVALAATRAMLAATTREQIVAILHTAVNDLGGGVLPARLAEGQPNVLEIDVALGVGEPRVVVADPLSLARMLLVHHLAVLVQDAQAAAAACDAVRRQAERAAVDPLTRVATRAEVAPRLAAAAPGDVLCMLDLDHFKELNDTHGHAAGDQALEALGEMLRQAVRDTDFCARYGGDEFVVLLAAVPVAVARQRMEALVSRWAALPGHGTGLSVGIAVVGAGGGAAAFEPADAALYSAKRSGRGRVVVAPAGDEERSDEQ